MIKITDTDKESWVNGFYIKWFENKIIHKCELERIINLYNMSPDMILMFLAWTFNYSKKYSIDYYYAYIINIRRINNS